MKKLILLPVFLLACGSKDANLAEVMVKAQAAKATCKSANIDGTDVTICKIPGKDKVVPFIAVYGSYTQPFQAYPLEAEKKEAPPAAAPPPAPPPAPPAATTTPVGEGSGAAAPEVK